MHRFKSGVVARATRDPVLRNASRRIWDGYAH
jgi:hypothetical protein